MFKSILVPIDLADTDLAKPAIATAATLSQTWSGTVRLLNVLPMTPVMLAEYVPADFDEQQRQTSEEALAIVARESGIEPGRISSVVRQGGIYHEILEEAAQMKADLIVMTSHRPAMRTYFLGSNAGHVVRYAKCSVLVVRHSARRLACFVARVSEATPGIARGENPGYRFAHPGYKMSSCPSAKHPSRRSTHATENIPLYRNSETTYLLPHPGPRKRGVSRSSRTRAGQRWTWVTPARRVLQGRQL